MTEYQIATGVLEAIVRGSLQGDNRVRFHSLFPLVKGRAVTVEVQDAECRVEVHVDARYGEHLPSLADEIRERVSAALSRMTGLRVAAVDVVYAGVFAE